jgi:hypothetical protein
MKFYVDVLLTGETLDGFWWNLISSPYKISDRDISKGSITQRTHEETLVYSDKDCDCQVLLHNRLTYTYYNLWKTEQNNQKLTGGKYSHIVNKGCPTGDTRAVWNQPVCFIRPSALSFPPPKICVNPFFGSSFGIEAGYELDSRGVGVRVPVGSSIFSSSRRPDRLWGHPASYPMATGGSFPGGKSAGAWSWPHHQLVPRSRKCGSIYLLPHTPS